MSGGGKSRSLGQWGERMVASALQAQGWSILECNYRCRYGEVDIIAENGTYLAFVEVKLRKDRRHGAGREWVTGAKQHRLRATAEHYLMTHPTHLQPRMDVAEIYAPEGMETRTPHINYLENAF